MGSNIADPGLASEGQLKIDWVREHMPVLNEIRRAFEEEKPFEGKTIAMSIHLEAKTAYLAMVLSAGGARVALTGSNPLSTQDDVAAAAAANGISVHARYGVSLDEYTRHLNEVLDYRPDIILDDGGDLVSLLHGDRKAQASEIIGGCEETTTGVMRLRALQAKGKLLFPMVSVNDARCKHLFDNRYGTGQSTWDGILRTTNLVIAGKNVVVAGYGWCGRGVAMRAKGLGARVIVTEVDPIKANEAYMDGYEVMTMKRAASIADFIITVTGCKDVVGPDHVPVLKDGVVLANAGHFDVEINKAALRAASRGERTVRRNITEYRMKDGRRVYLLAEGRLVNLAAGDGHPVEIMDMSFGLQALSLRFLLEHQGELKNEVIPVPEDIDEIVAELRLSALGVEIDRLTDEQRSYMFS